MLKILLTVPVTTATAERSFSSLGRIFNERRKCMTTNRLSNLALLSFHFETAGKIDPNEVVDLFASSKRRVALI